MSGNFQSISPLPSSAAGVGEGIFQFETNFIGTGVTLVEPMRDARRVTKPHWMQSFTVYVSLNFVVSQIFIITDGRDPSTNQGHRKKVPRQPRFFL